MIRFTVTIIAALAIVVTAAIWFGDRPGMVSIEWQSWLIEMSVGRFVLATTILLSGTLFVIGFFRAVGHLPGRIRESLRISRRERGYRALTQGMVAVAAGDPDEADRQARRADVLLEEPPLTMLLMQRLTVLDPLHAQRAKLELQRRRNLMANDGSNVRESMAAFNAATHKCVASCPAGKAPNAQKDCEGDRY